MSIEEERAKAEAAEVARTAATPGWKIIEKWIEDQIQALRLKLEAESDIDNPTTHLLSSKGEIKIVAVSINKGYAKHAIRAFRVFQNKMKNWDEARGKPDDA